jgi:sugar (pentulose or hexulose) kinase
VTLLPHLVNERAPTWPTTSGSIVGITAATSAAAIYRAAMTASYYRLAAILDLVEGATRPVERVVVSGGVLNSPRLLAILSDALGRDLHVCRERESSLRGAALHVLRERDVAIAPLPGGRTIRHNPEIAARHRERRNVHGAFERLLERSRQAATSDCSGGLAAASAFSILRK